MIAANRHVGTLEIDLILPQPAFGHCFAPLRVVISRAINCRDCVFPWVCSAARTVGAQTLHHTLSGEYLIIDCLAQELIP